MKELFQFNPLKHHLQFIASFCKYYRNNFNEDEFKNQLLQVGRNVTDIYTGSLTAEQIIGQIDAHLTKENIIDYIKYSGYINDQPKAYINILINDGSEWTLTMGENKEKFVHVHPARSSKNVVRVRSNALKTAILINVFTDGGNGMNLKELNRLRRRYPNLPPLKTLNKKSMISLLSKALKDAER